MDDKKKKKRIIDLRRFFDRDEKIISDVDGSYTGTPVVRFTNLGDNEPVQDADDL